MHNNETTTNQVMATIGACISLIGAIYLLPINDRFKIALYIIVFCFLCFMAVHHRRKDKDQNQFIISYLVIVDAADDVSEYYAFELDHENVVGRHEGCDISLNDKYISSKHAILEWNSSNWWIRDISSSNGTFVNGEEIEKITLLKFGDYIRFGQTITRLSQ